ncbi:TetR/AcrR family transcriptional regulator [Teredinibacter sp. KSP-S5-2]|uniref:TetR/AcrR family transcriptional regulator n=1 Tax=Teredinibacter sp. KSP-S5-2 TaxID=3034506 RepID=UPI0029346AEA|nr:TetR/AcrR family transcriptional regulator [Teredinibacter sp. KSP-S5-2]WNO11124.1 TetR/AcrR family transcriptional regulator [Teredinibacter sp. KSP-S5-2]
MKVSREQKEKTRRLIVDTAIDMFVEKGIDKATMKGIARKAGIGDATIYKYFPSKEKLILGYYKLKADDTLAELWEEEIDEYSLREKLQLLVDIYLQQLLPDREFVASSAKYILTSQSFMWQEVAPIRQEFAPIINRFLDEAEFDQEIPAFPFRGALVGLMNEFLIGVLLYWIKDDSEEFSNTTQMVDMSLNLGVNILQSGIANQLMDFVGFFVKRHLFQFIQNGGHMFRGFADKMNSMEAENTWEK